MSLEYLARLFWCRQALVPLDFLTKKPCCCGAMGKLLLTAVIWMDKATFRLLRRMYVTRKLTKYFFGADHINGVFEHAGVRGASDSQ